MKVIFNNEKKQYSKVYMSRWQWFCMFWVSIYFCADIYYNHGMNINNVVILLVSSIVGTLIPYFAKSYLETKEEHKNSNIETSICENSTLIDNFETEVLEDGFHY